MYVDVKIRYKHAVHTYIIQITTAKYKHMHYVTKCVCMEQGRQNMLQIHV